MTWRVDVGDCRDLLAAMPERSVQACVTSPPYFGLRDYGTGEWEGGNAACDHKGAPKQSASSTLVGNGHGAGKPLSPYLQGQSVPTRDCPHCGAVRVDRQIGLEPTPDEFVAALVNVFRDVRRVLRDDGTLWLNLGDSYCAAASGQRSQRDLDRSGWDGAFKVPSSDRRDVSRQGVDRRVLPALKQKDLIGIPWMVAFALRADGWYLRSDIIWAKPNPMPESTRDRPTSAHEHVFLMSKSARYHYDADAIAEDAVSDHPSGNGYARHERQTFTNPDGTPRGDGAAWSNVGGKRNRRNVWTVPTKPFAGAHFATFPPTLIEPCILAGAPEGAIVLDPFAGAGTTGVVALRHGRSFVGCELNPGYAALARRRIVDDAPLLNSHAEQEAA